MIFTIAWRSVVRNRRRTVVTTGAMSLAGLIMIFYVSLLDGYIVAMKRNALTLDLGEIQIHATGYRTDPDLFTRIDDHQSIIDAIVQDKLHASPRLFGFALAAAKDTSAGVQLRGVDVAREKTVTRIHERVDQGQWLDPSDPTGAVIGRKLARSLGVSVGAELVILGQGADGSMANELLKVRGVLQTVSEIIDRSGVFIPEATFRELMVVPDGAHEIAIISPTPLEDLDAAVARVARHAEGHDTASWRDLQPVIARMLDMSKGSVMFLLLVCYAAVAVVVLNATLMSVFERMREFGIMKAVGVSPWQIAGIVLVEAALQCTLAALVAVAGGVPLALYYQRHGIDLTSLLDSGSFAGVAIDPIWYTSVTPEAVLTPVIMLFVVMGFAVIYPGIKAAVLQPLDAMRHR